MTKSAAPTPKNSSDSAKPREFAPEALSEKAPPKLIVPRVPCLRCHANGPRFIRPENPLAGEKAKLQTKWNDSIEDIGLVQDVLSLNAEKAASNPDLPFKTCTACHNDKKGVRGSLKRSHNSSIEFLLNTGAMPLGEHALNLEEKSCIIEWLDSKSLSKKCEIFTQEKKTAGEGLKLKIKTQFTDFEISNFKTKIRLICKDRICKIFGSMALNKLKTGISLRDQHLKKVIGEDYQELNLESAEFAEESLRRAEISSVFKIRSQNQSFLKNVRITCANEQCRVLPTKIKLSELQIKSPHYFGLSIDEEMELSGDVELEKSGII